VRLLDEKEERLQKLRSNGNTTSAA
jgi:hypothetical protein